MPSITTASTLYTLQRTTAKPVRHLLSLRPDFEKTCSGAPLVSQLHLGGEGFAQLFLDGNNAWAKSSALVVVVDLYEDGRRAVLNENGIGTVLLPSHVVSWMQLDVLYDSGRINKGGSRRQTVTVQRTRIFRRTRSTAGKRPVVPMS